MILSKSNIIPTNTITLDVGTISSGALANLQNPDFSKVLSSNSTILEITIEAVGSSQFIAMHGLILPIGAVVTLTGTGYSKTYTMTRDIRNLVFYVSTAITPGDLTIEISGAGEKTISYIQAGAITKIDWGVSAGQNLRYLSHNKKSRITTNSRAMPTKAVQEEVSPKLTVNFTNAPKAFARTEFLEVLNHYDTNNIVSMLDYEDEGRPEESYCLFDLNGGDVVAHPQTPLLVNISMSFRVSA